MPSLLGRRIRFGKPASRSVADVENVTHRPISGRKTAGGIGARIRLGLSRCVFRGEIVHPDVNICYRLFARRRSKCAAAPAIH